MGKANGRKHESPHEPLATDSGNKVMMLILYCCASGKNERKLVLRKMGEASIYNLREVLLELSRIQSE